MHAHVESPDGGLKVWLEPRIEVAQNHGIPEREITKILRILEKRHGEIDERWREHRRRSSRPARSWSDDCAACAEGLEPIGIVTHSTPHPTRFARFPLPAGEREDHAAP